jgi:hypothetical protein
VVQGEGLGSAKRGRVNNGIVQIPSCTGTVTARRPSRIVIRSSRLFLSDPHHRLAADHCVPWGEAQAVRRFASFLFLMKT